MSRELLLSKVMDTEGTNRFQLAMIAGDVRHSNRKIAKHTWNAWELLCDVQQIMNVIDEGRELPAETILNIVESHLNTLIDPLQKAVAQLIIESDQLDDVQERFIGKLKEMEKTASK